MNMNRRTFVALAARMLFAGGVRKASPSTEPAKTAEPFRISQEDYRKVEAEYLPQLVEYPAAEAPGTIIIDPEHRFLYLVLGQGRAKRYGVGVGREGFGWSGTATIRRKAQWPRWIPPKEMMARDPKAAQWPDGMPGGPENPFGARALYLYQGEVDTLYRIHGTPEAGSIGRAVSSGCIRMLNADVAELYDRVAIGAKVVVLPAGGLIAGAGDAAPPAAPLREVQVDEIKIDEPPASPSWRATSKPVFANADERQRAIRAVLARRREMRRRRLTVEDWLLSLEDDG